ncbi:hypothetical protein F383_00603 [Gossypium arboreum]|uniref:Uncharacterized protein n=1 Tax=Gossypium arboreum TaxID=29729 RepID=A0A0B0PH39_GOSAR|nr:hypothetical protein F383_01109 [Gossypium arboreum]KHG26153.1 hypothetical protein F383_00603 [Gossypium arboreum]
MKYYRVSVSAFRRRWLRHMSLGYLGIRTR